MGSLLVHVTHGPEAPTRAALAFLVARTAQEAGHDVAIFVAGDGVGLLRAAVLGTLRGVGTGELGAHVEAVLAGGASLTCSGQSCAARGISVNDLPAGAEVAPPSRLVELVFGHDRVLCY